MRNVVVYEKFDHFVPTGNGWAEGFEELGYNVEKISSLNKSIYDLSVRDTPIDIFVLFGNDVSNVNKLKELKSKKNCKIIYVIFGFEEYFKDLRETVDLWVEHIYKHDIIEDLFGYEKMKFKLVPLGSSTKLFYPTNESSLDRYEYDVNFIGQFCHGNRNEETYLFPIINKCYKGFYSGFQHNGVNYPYVNHTDLNKIYNKTKVNLNFHYPHQKTQSMMIINEYLEFNGRTFEIPMSQNFQLCDHPHIVEFFGEGIVYADKSDWFDKFEYYVKNDNERAQLEKIARENCLKNHSWKCRMESVTKALQ